MVNMNQWNRKQISSGVKTCLNALNKTLIFYIAAKMCTFAYTLHLLSHILHSRFQLVLQKAKFVFFKRSP